MLRFEWGFQFCLCSHVDNNFRQNSKFRNFRSKTCLLSKRFLETRNYIIFSCGSHFYWKEKHFPWNVSIKKLIAIERNCRNFNGGHPPYFYTLYFWGLPYLTERSSVCDFDRTVKFLSNDSQIIATFAKVFKHTVKLNTHERNILKLMHPNNFVQCISNAIQSCY